MSTQKVVKLPTRTMASTSPFTGELLQETVRAIPRDAIPVALQTFSFFLKRLPN